MSMRCVLLVLLVSATLAACAAEEADVEVDTRACNDTGSDLTEVSYAWTHDTPALAAGECTEYVHSSTPVTRSPRVVFTLGADHYYAPPDDVPARPNASITEGRWTYRLFVYDAAHLRAGVDAEQDQ